ncbi:MAG: hypothetical protein JSV61_07335 [Anaerolineales bacterium]|nr:MAG: hypothetical protein JSV61_07335 [Anaerolineales bacterium]
MRSTRLTAGARGDVQPYRAHGKGLQTAGFQVRLATILASWQVSLMVPVMSQDAQAIQVSGLGFYPGYSSAQKLRVRVAALGGIRSGAGVDRAVAPFETYLLTYSFGE